MTNKTQELVSAVEQELINKLPHMTVNDLLQTYSQASYRSHTEPVEPTVTVSDTIHNCEGGKIVSTEKKTPTPDEKVEVEEETPEPEPKPAKKKRAAKKTTKKKEPVEEKTEEETDVVSDEDTPEFEDMYEECRAEYDNALKRGVDSDQFIEVVKELGHDSIDDITDMLTLTTLRDRTLQLEAL